MASGAFQNMWYPLLGDTRKDPRFKAIVRDVGWVDLWRKTGTMERLLPAVRGRRFRMLHAVVRVFVPAGATDEAIDQLDDYLGTRGAAWTIEGLLPDPMLDRIRDNPRFVALVQMHRRR